MPEPVELPTVAPCDAQQAPAADQFAVELVDDGVAPADAGEVAREGAELVCCERCVAFCAGRRARWCQPCFLAGLALRLR